MEDTAVDAFLTASFGTFVMTLWHGVLSAPSWHNCTYLGLWLGPRLGPTDHHSLSLGQWRGPGEALLALFCFLRRSPVPVS